MEINVGIRRAYLYGHGDKKISAPENYANIEIRMEDWNRALSELRKFCNPEMKMREKAIVLSSLSSDFKINDTDVFYKPSVLKIFLEENTQISSGYILTKSFNKKDANITARKLFGWKNERLEKIVDTSETEILIAGS